MRPQCIALASALLLGCAGEITFVDLEQTFDDAHAMSVILEGEELENELTESPVRAAPVPFTRVGLLWDAEVSVTIEFSTSTDGETWSAWGAAEVLDVEMEGPGYAALTDDGEEILQGGTSLVGVFRTPHEGGYEPALYYRVRAASGELPTFLNMEFLELSLAESLEDGESVEESSIGMLQHELSVGDTNVNPRSSWNARAPRCQSNTSPSRITIHHTVTPTNDSLSPQARLRQIQSYHMNVLGWCDIGYNFLVSRDGRLWAGRGANRLGTHTGGNNSNNVGISLMGTYTSTAPTGTQLTRTAALMRGLSKQYGFPLNRSRVHGHRDFNQTACPGNRLYADLGELIRRANDGGGNTSPPPPPSDGTTVKGIIYRGNDTSRRLAGATVRLGTRTTQTNASGYYEFRNVSAGNQQIRASLSGFETRTITRSVSGAETWGSMGLRREATGNSTLVGVVYRGTNSANRIGGATITLSNGVTTRADANGYFELKNLPAGDVRITASAPGYTSRSVNRTLTSGATTWGSVSL
jgi:hypothetical protein